jgi:hypothetical protein
MARVRVQVPAQTTLEQNPAPAQPPATNQPQQMRRPFDVRKTIIVLGVVLVVALFIMLLNDRNKLKSEVQKQSTATQQSAGQSDALKYQEEIGKIAELPSGQTPSLVTVSDAQKLAGENSFFKNAKNGDVVLLYVSPDKSVRAILYRPSTKKVIEVTSSATIGGGTSSVAPTGSTKR